MNGIDEIKSDIDDLHERLRVANEKLSRERAADANYEEPKMFHLEFISREISDVHPVHSYVIANDETIATEKLLKGQATVDKLLTVQLVARQHRANGVGELIF